MEGGKSKFIPTKGETERFQPCGRGRGAESFEVILTRELEVFAIMKGARGPQKLSHFIYFEVFAILKGARGGTNKFPFYIF